MDDLHPDSDDANSVKTTSDDTENTQETDKSMDAKIIPVTGNAPADTAASEATAEPQNGATGDHGANGASVEAANVEAANVEAASAPTNPSPADSPTPPQEGVTPQDDETWVSADAPESAEAAAQPEQPEQPEQPDDTSDFSNTRELGRDAWGRILLAWRGGADGQGEQHPPVILLERATLDVDAATRIIETHLYHARLLAPRALLQREGGAHWLVVEAPASYDAPFVAIGDGGRLDPRAVLKAGVGLANALSYLHTNGVAHGHVEPNAILVHDGRAYLSGVERAEVVETLEEASVAKFTADVTALAHALALLAGLPREMSADEDSTTQAIRAIAARAETSSFVTAEDLAQECGQALQEPALTLPAADDAAMSPLVFHCGTATTVGLLRSQNQDALGCTVLDIRDDVGRDRPLGIFLVADGMGGEAAGEIASRIGARIAMAELVRQLLVPTVAMPALEPLSPDHTTGVIGVATLAQALAIAVDAANRQVRTLAATLQESTGTTLTAVVVAGGRAVLAHLGDSRAYLMRDGALVQLTKDHSLLARLEELDHPLLNDPSFGMPRNYLYRSLGQEDEAPPDMMEFPVVPGDRLLLCSDGLWDELDDATIQRCLTSTDDPGECANHLVRLANAAGGHDNSTAVVVFVEAQPDDPATEISPEEADAILRASGALDDDDGNEEISDDSGVVDDAFDMGLG